MVSKRLLTILAVAGSAALIGLAPVYADEEGYGELQFSSEESEQIAALDSDELLSSEESEQIAALDSDELGLTDEESSQVAALDESYTEEGLAGRAGFEDSVGSTMDSIESSISGGMEGHWNVQVPSGGGNIDD